MHKSRREYGFEDGIKILEERGKTKVVGVVPYMKVKLDDEDSLSERFEKTGAKNFDIAVIRLLHISNFTDFDTFEQLKDVSVRYVSEAYDDYYDEDFEILTIGLCESLDLLNEYRKEAWTLKWNNGIETKLFAGPIARTFEITQIPFSILIAPDGRIVEVGETLAGRFLNKTLAKYLKKSE